MTIYLNAMGIVSALGNSQASVRHALFALSASGVMANDVIVPGQSLHLGAVREPLVDNSLLPEAQRSRNNTLLLTALAQIRPSVEAAIACYGPERVAVVLGTSTSGIGEGEAAMLHHLNEGTPPPNFHLSQQELGSPAVMLSQLLGLAGPALVISTACSSSAKAMASGARLLLAGQADVVITGGMDALCRFTVAGFSSLESVSAERCLPMSRNRHGINIGEGGALFVMSKEPGPVRLAGWGESSDAHHISSPKPDGSGATAAMQAALTRAGLQPSDIDYINLHGTATPQNDAMESLAVNALFGAHRPSSSTKPLTGHTLGGAGALEAAICWLTLYENPTGQLPPHWWDGADDPALPTLHFVTPGEQLERSVRYALSNSFAFGGSNACLILGQP